MKKQEIIDLITKWQNEGVVSMEQADHMRKDVTYVTSERSGTGLITLIMYMGAIGLALGALLFISSNWEYLGKGVKLFLALLLPIAPLSFAYWKLVVQKSTSALPQVANILGLVMIGGALALIGQIYNLENNFVRFFWLWTLMSVPLIAVFQRRENVVFAAAIVGVSAFVSFIDFATNTDIKDGVALIVLTVGTLLYAFAIYAIGNALRNIPEWLDSGRLLRLGGAYISIITLFITTFEFYARMVMGGSAFSFFYTEEVNWQPISILFNLLFVGWLVFCLYRSVKFEEYSFAFWIVRIFALFLVVKYYVLFFSILHTGLFFMIGGILFIAGAWYLEKYKHVLIKHLQ